MQCCVVMSIKALHKNMTFQRVLRQQAMVVTMWLVLQMEPCKDVVEAAQRSYSSEEGVVSSKAGSRRGR